MQRIVSICIKAGKGQPPRKVNTALIKEGTGLVDDIHSSSDERQISLLDNDVRNKIMQFGKKGFCTVKFVENITTEGVNLRSLKKGNKLALGTVLIEVTEVGKKCFEDCPIVKNGDKCGLSEEVVFARVVKGGEIKVNDKVKVL